MLISLAVDFRHADVATREVFHLSPERLATLYDHAPTPAPTAELAAIQTCNRSELYAWVPGVAAQADVEVVARRMARRWMGNATDARRLLDAASIRLNEDAVRHLFRVASGIESQVLGDGQLLGQLKDAYAHATRSGGVGSVLHRMVEMALHVGKRVRSETGLSSGRHSIGAEAASVAARRFGASLGGARVVIVGAGKTGERAARQLVKLGARDLVVVNRTLDRAETLARALRMRAAPWERLYGELALSDIAVVATASTAPVVDAEPLRRARAHFATAAAPLLLLDLSVPRNVDPALADGDATVVVDLDALRPALAAGERERVGAVPHAERIVEAELRGFLQWLEADVARVAMRPLRDALAEICRREVAFAAGDEGMAERVAERVVAKMLARPMVELRSALLRGERVDGTAEELARLFGGPAPVQEPGGTADWG